MDGRMEVLLLAIISNEPLYFPGRHEYRTTHISCLPFHPIILAGTKNCTSFADRFVFPISSIKELTCQKFFGPQVAMEIDRDQIHGQALCESGFFAADHLTAFQK